MATIVEGYAVCQQGQPLIGVVVNLYNVTNFEVIVATTTTDSSGHYSFTGLADGDYIARIISGVIGTIGAERFTYQGGEWRWGTGTVGTNFTGVRIDQEGVRGYANNVVTFDLDVTTGSLVLTGLDLDDIGDGTTYKRLLATQISAGAIYLSDASTYKVGYDPSGKRRVFTATPTTPYDVGDLWLDASVVKRCTTARASGAYVAGDWTATTLDAVTDGTTYSRVLTADITAGHVLLSACSGTLDNIGDGSTYGKVALTGITAGKIIVAGLDSGVTARMFLDAATKTNMEAWRHASDVTLIDGGDIYANSITLTKVATEVTDRMFDSGTLSDNIQGWPHATDATKIDGGDIYTGSVTAAKITVTSLSALNADMGTLTAGIIKMGTGTKDTNLTGFQLDTSEIVGQLAGVDQVYISAADGKLYAGAGGIILSGEGLQIQGASTYGKIEFLITGIAGWLGQLWATHDAENTYGVLHMRSQTTSTATMRTWIDMEAKDDALSRLELGATIVDGTASLLHVRSSDDGAGLFNVSKWLGVTQTILSKVSDAGHLSTYGYIYPGTGAAIQSSRYIYDTGTALALGTGGDLVGTTLSQTLTTKTLTSPTINGTIATTGLTMPNFTLGSGYVFGPTNEGIILRALRQAHPYAFVIQTPGVAPTYTDTTRLIIYGSENIAHIIWSACTHNGLDITSGQVLKVAGIQVIAARVVDARCDDAINSGDATTDGVIDALRDAMITHGLIAAA